MGDYIESLVAITLKIVVNTLNRCNSYISQIYLPMANSTVGLSAISNVPPGT